MAVKFVLFKRSPRQSLSLPQLSAKLLFGGLLLSGLQASAQTATAHPTKAETKNEITTQDKNSKAENKVTVLQAVTVRARNRLEKLQDVPLSVSVVSGAELERLQAVDIASFSKRVGNVVWNPGNPRQFSLSIRGVGKQAQTDAQDPSVGIIVDGVNYAYNPLSSSVDFTDIAGVEVTRGPQGTLLGKNTSLGVINITTKRPTFKSEAYGSFSYGQRSTLFATSTLGGTVIDDLLAWRGTFSAHKGRGDLVNLYNPDLTYANKDRFSGRVHFLLTPSEDFDAIIRLDAQPKAGEASNGRTFNKPTPNTYADNSTNPLNSDASTRLNRRWFLDQGSYTYEKDWLGNSERNAINADNYNPIVTGTNGASTELNWRQENFDITSITAYKDYYFDARNDEGTPYDISKNGGGLVDYKQYSQELRLSSKTGGFVDYQTGLFWLKQDTDHSNRVGWGSDAGAWFASKNQYSTLDTNSSGRALLQDSLSRLYRVIDAKYLNESSAIFAQANWHFSEPLTLTTGVRFTREDRTTHNSALIGDNGAGQVLNAVTVSNVNLGGFDSDSKGLLTANNSAQQLALADALAKKYFGAANYAALDATQHAQVAAAKALRKAQLGVLWNDVDAESFTATQPAFVVSPSYKFNENLTSYFSWQYGEKAGIAQIVNGRSYPTKAEKSSSFELGLKTALLNNTLVLNADVFVTDIKDYQQSVQVEDEYTTEQNILNHVEPSIAYTGYTGNVPKVRAQGLEVDGVYSGLRNTTIRFSGAYNDAYYVSFPNSAQPVENGYTGALAYRDISGETLPGSSKYTFNLGVDYRLPVFSAHEFHTSLNTAYNSKFNSDNALSSYGWVNASVTTDFSIGLGKVNNSFDVNLVVKNLFDDDTNQSQTWNSWNPALPRFVQLVVSGKF
ncbi:MAG TPA: TonB-dependent receptor [Cellvibrio sp.]|nr:TonB-dependent receptor [Cellvibrio sp.]